ncbi:MAG: UDP-N-acetylmuramate dehydrogenase [Tannerellaceae bacterium]|jgi:UDP-N-acetylmuramate dehydrogenase|nr:UDP-N-acetylmuramate dehydrogenase [Tannerellaceae bacterium]
MLIHENYSLRHYNTFGIDVSARWFIEYADDEDLSRLLRDEYFSHCKSIHIGKGSNLLFLKNYDGIVLHSGIGGMKVREEGDDIFLRVGAGILWDDVVIFVLKQGWSGPENLSFIPGEVGAAAVQNIGAYASEVKDFIHSVEVMDKYTGHGYAFAASECNYEYRYSRFKEDNSPFIITHVVFRFSRNQGRCVTDYGRLYDDLPDCPTPLDVREAVIRLRRSKIPDPSELGNAGSFFMNPVVSPQQFVEIQSRFKDIPYYSLGEQYKIPAGWLIEQCGFKGFRQGDAGVYERQALVLVNHGKATGADIARLAERIVEKVQSRFAIRLTPEVKYISAVAGPLVPKIFSEETDLQTFSFRLVIRRSDTPLRLREHFRISLREGLLVVLCSPDTCFEERAIQWQLQTILRNVLRDEAKRLLPVRLSMLAERHGFIYEDSKVNSARTRWGSCSGRKVINLSCFLLLLPEHLIDYILLHELCHTKEMNHGTGFWRLLDEVTNGSAHRLRKELKMKGMQ